MQVKVKKLHPDAKVPQYAEPGASGLDLHAYIRNGIYYGRRLIIEPGDSAIISTGIAIQIPEGYEGQIRPRSGLAAKNMISIINTPGTIDRSYSGELMVILINLSKDECFRVGHEDRIAQLVIAPVAKAELIEVDELEQTERGEGRFGSTGV